MKRKLNYSVWVEGRKNPIWNDYAKNKVEALKKVKVKLKNIGDKRKIKKISKWNWENTRWEKLKLELSKRRGNK